MNRLLDRLIIMISTLLVILLWTLAALTPIVLLLVGVRLADQKQRRRSKHLRESDSLDH